jgi:hypothetical protein
VLYFVEKETPNTALRNIRFLSHLIVEKENKIIELYKIRLQVFSSLTPENKFFDIISEDLKKLEKLILGISNNEEENIKKEDISKAIDFLKGSNG